MHSSLGRAEYYNVGRIDSDENVDRIKSVMEAERRSVIMSYVRDMRIEKTQKKVLKKL